MSFRRIYWASFILSILSERFRWPLRPILRNTASKGANHFFLKRAAIDRAPTSGFISSNDSYLGRTLLKP